MMIKHLGVLKNSDKKKMKYFKNFPASTYYPVNNYCVTTKSFYDIFCFCKCLQNPMQIRVKIITVTD